MRLSYSAFQLFKDCPYLFKYVHLEGRSLPKSPQQIFGTLLHTSLKEIFEKAPHFPPLTQVLKNFEHRWQKSALPELFTDQSEQKMYQTDARQLLTSFYTKFLTPNVDVVALERSFNLPLKDPQTGETHIITGRLDRLDRLRDGGFLIIDYKTGRSLPAEATVKENLQLALYTLAVHHMWPMLLKKKKAPVEVALHYLRHNEQITATVSTYQLKKTKAEVLKIIRAIQKSDFPAKPSQRCAMFPYHLVCPYYRDQFRAEKPKIKGAHEVASVVNEFYELKKQDKKIKQRLAELASLIEEYLAQEKLAAIYSDQGGVAQVSYDTYEIDETAVKKILSPLGLWEKVLTIDTARLKEIADALPEATRTALLEAKIPKTKRSTLRLIKRAPTQT